MTRPGGRVITLRVSDYQNSVGPLTLRVERIDRMHPVVDGGNRYPVAGVQ
jgi:hypothetical protein